MESAKSVSPAASTSLPRGLVTRSGLPVDPGQRIPSLRSSSTSSMSSGNLLNGNRAIVSLNNTNKTRGGATKRTFKPNVPTKEVNVDTNNIPPATSSPSVDVKSNIVADSKRSTGSKNTSRGGGQANKRSSNARPAKPTLVQTESSVFVGSIGKIRVNKVTSAPSDRSTVSVLKQSKSNDEDEINGPVRRRLDSLLNDDFIDYSDTSEDEESKYKSRSVKPIGWDNLIHGADEGDKKKRKQRNTNQDKTDDDSTFKAGELIETKAKAGTSGHLVLMQLPHDLLSISPEVDPDSMTPDLNLIGRLRVHKSGKVSLMTESGSTYEVNLTDHLEKDSVDIKSEDGGRKNLVKLRDKTTATTHFTMNQLAVHYDRLDDQVVSLGSIMSSEKLIVLPQINVKKPS